MLQFESPLWFLALLPLLPWLLYWRHRSYADLSPLRSWLGCGLRVLALAAVVLALSRPVLLLRNRDRAVLFLVDVSDSVPDTALDEAWSQVSAAATDLDSGCSAGLVLFAGAPVLARPLQAEPLELTDELRRRMFHQREKDRLQARAAELERSDLDETARAELQRLRQELDGVELWRREIGAQDTDLEAACRLARALLPAEARGRLALFSDGNATRGDLLREIAELRQGGVSLHAQLLRRADKPDVLAEELRVPAEVQIRAPFNAEIALNSNYETDAEVRFFRNKFLVSTQALRLKPGKNLLQVPKISLEEGFHEFEAVVAAAGDTRLENNVARAAVRVAGRPKVLLVERERELARHLEEALAAADIQVETRPEAGVPAEMNDLLNYDALILSDVAASAMTVPQMELIKRYVREMGGGLVMLGGEHSFGLGGYYRTPVEDALPVRMPMRKNVEKPNLALLLVIDKSGSMGGDKIELAKEAAIASAEVLKPADRFGVIAFDSLAETICPVTDAADLAGISSQIARLASGGGTHIYPALYDAYQALLSEDAKLKHIILLSDGHTEGTGYDQLVSHIAADGITLSCVGIGEGADEKLLGGMAEGAGGEYYFTNDFASIPQIFTRETLRASKSMLVEEPFLPQVTAETEALKGVDLASMPFLLGYVATQAKPTATVALKSEYGDPVLATWRYGLGRAAAFTSDAKARWAADWIGWSSFSKFWGQLVRSVMSTGAHHELRSSARVDVAGGSAALTLDVRGRAGEFRDDVRPEVSLYRSGEGAEPLPVEHLAPGLYRARFPLQSNGDFYRLMLVQKQGEDVVDLKALAVTQSYSPEFRNLMADAGVLRLAAAETGGVYAPAPEQVWEFSGDAARTLHDTWWWWLLLAILVLPLDLALRRFGLG
ncbi:MAG: VWA domain-containing protein [Planctomycetota bacterium]|nr:MAG: VWA domain-containing protein [Planctomycetota bacterium]